MVWLAEIPALALVPRIRTERTVYQTSSPTMRS